MKLFVGSLPYQTTEEELQDLFASHGSVSSVKIISDRDTGRSKGFAFVEMDSKESGSAAIKELNGSSFGGRTLVVNEAHDKKR